MNEGTTEGAVCSYSKGMKEMLLQLIVEADEVRNPVRFRLLDEHGVQLVSRQVLLDDHDLSHWEGLFDTRRYVDRLEGNLLGEGKSEPAIAEELISELGVFLGEKVLGPEIMKELTRTKQRRELLVRLSSVKEGAASGKSDESAFVSVFARIPWEIARLSLEDQPLMERNLVVRVVTEDTARLDIAMHANLQLEQRDAEGAPEAATRRRNLGVGELMEALTQAAASGQDLEPLLADLRAHLLNAAPGKERAIDAGMEELRRQMEGIRKEGLKPGQ